MGWFRREERAERPLTSADLVTLFTPLATNLAGVNLSETTAPRSTAVWRAVSLLSGIVASLPLKAYRSGAGGRLEVPNALLERPHPTFTRFELLELAMVHLLLAGNAYFVKQRNRLGEVTALLPIAPNLVVPKLDDAGLKTFEVPGTDRPRIEVGSDVVLHVPGMGYDGVKGWSPISMCRQALAVGLAAEEFSARFFGSGSMLGGVLQTDAELTKEQADETKARWREKVVGLGKAHEIAVLDRNLKFQSVGIAPEDAQLIESRDFSIQDTARVFGVPAHLLSTGSKDQSWASGLSEQVRGLLVFTAGPWLSRLEARFSTELAPEGEYHEFTRAGLLQSTTKERYEVYEIGIKTGVLTVNECRAMENLPALPEPPAAPRLEVVPGA